jgi:hypothetical protein
VRHTVPFSPSLVLCDTHRFVQPVPQAAPLLGLNPMAVVEGSAGPPACAPPPAMLYVSAGVILAGLWPSLSHFLRVERGFRTSSVGDRPGTDSKQYRIGDVRRLRRPRGHRWLERLVAQ